MINQTSDVRKPAVPEGRMRWARYVGLGGVCALVIGVYVGSAHSGLFELLGSKAGDSYYNLLVEGFRAGQLNLKAGAPPGLAELSDPYDPQASSSYWLLVGHPLWDTSYYRGKLYLYFGVTPALVLFWPYAVLTGHHLLHKDAVVLFFSVGFLVSAGLLWAIWRRYFAEASFWTVVAGTLVLGLANFIPAILQRSDIWEVAISCGYALTMLALAAMWGALHDSAWRSRWLVAASLAYGLAVGARPSLLLGAIILLVPVAQAWRQKQRVWPALVAATGPIMLIGLGLMLYNTLRFNNPLEFGQRYQLVPVRQDTIPQFSLRYLWFNFRVGFLAPARWSGHFPFMRDIAMPPLPRGSDVEHPFGVLTNIPLVWLALAAPLAWRSRSAAARSTLRWLLGALALLFATCALTLGLHNSMCLRYEVEFASTLMLLAVIGILGLERALGSQPVWRCGARCAWGLLLAFSVTFNLLAGFARHADAEVNLGNALLQKGQVNEAVAHFQKALQIQPGDAYARCNLGSALLRKGQVDEALVCLQRALDIQPDNAEARNNLGYALFRKGQVEEAIAQYQKALKIQPDYAMAYCNLGNIFFRKGQVNEAIAHFKRALELQPGNVEAHNNLGLVLDQAGQLDEAIAHFQKCLELQPGNAEAHNNLGYALLQKGQVDGATVEFEECLKLEPEYQRAQLNLGHAAWLLATSPEATVRDGARAVELAGQADRLSGGNNAVIGGTLAAAYAEAGRFAEAVTTARHALQLATARTNAVLVNALQAQVKLYQAGSPFRDTGLTNAPRPQASRDRPAD